MWGYIVGGLMAAVVVPGTFRALKEFLHPKISGARGEAAVDRKLRKFKGGGFSRSRDIMLPAPGKTAQIDNILVSRHGIFVIEMKNYTGSVRGTARESQWVHVFKKGRGQREFLNPIWQNEKHIEALHRCLKNKYPNIPYYNLAVFGNKCLPPRLPGVCNLRDMNKIISEKMAGEPVLSCEDVSAIQKIIEERNITDKNRRLQHISDARHTAKVNNARESYDARRVEAKQHQQAVAMLKNKPDLDTQIRAASFRPRNDGRGNRGSFVRDTR